MKLWSISFAFRLGLGFHALNNEGADGSNLMQPRRIDVGDLTYDGISGEIVRHHILENFVGVCQREGQQTLPLSAGLHPDRGPLGIRAAARVLGHPTLSNERLYPSVRKAIECCAVLDIGGFLAAWQEVGRQSYVAEGPYIDSDCAPLQTGANNRIEVEVVKRDSCFDVGWLISEAPQDLTVTQHSAYRTTFALNSRYAQTMRSNIYGGVIRADLHRIATDDYWYLQQGNGGKGRADRVISSTLQIERQRALVEAIGNFIAAPAGAKTAAWAPHVFLTEGAILVTSARTAPFTSPIKVDLKDSKAPVKANPGYAEAMKNLHNDRDIWYWSFDDAKTLLDAVEKIKEKIGADSEAKEQTKEN